MLASNFKTAKVLKLSKEQHAALVLTLHMMEAGKIKHVKTKGAHVEDGDTFTGHFNMGFWKLRSDPCRTVACIGGTAELLGHVSFGERPGQVGDVASSDALSDLFFPYEVGEECAWTKITVKQAAQALRNYLTFGKPKWREVMKG